MGTTTAGESPRIASVTGLLSWIERCIMLLGSSRNLDPAPESIQHVDNGLLSLGPTYHDCHSDSGLMKLLCISAPQKNEVQIV